MTLELGDVIARIGGDGGGGAAAHRYVYDLGDMPIDPGGQSAFQVPDVPEGATLVATLEWTGPETGGLNVGMIHGDDAALGVTFGPGADFLPITVVATASGVDRGVISLFASAEGFTATSLTAIIIPTINEAT